MSIAQFIKEDVIARIEGGDLAPDSPLTLGELSKLYNVSTTPVRAAIEELVNEKYLIRKTNHRLAIRSQRRGTRGSVRDPVRPKDHYQLISDDLLQLSLQGKETHLREEAMAKEYGISRTSLRQIFSRLVGDGVLTHLPRRGWKLRPFRQKDFDAYQEIRLIMELKALDLSKHVLVEKELRSMLDGNRYPETEEDRPQIDDRFHDYLIAKAENPYITDFFQRHGRYYEIIFHWESFDRAAALQTVKQHREILTALIERDWTSAAERLEQHIRDNHPVLQELLRKRAQTTS